MEKKFFYKAQRTDNGEWVEGRVGQSQSIKDEIEETTYFNAYDGKYWSSCIVLTSTIEPSTISEMEPEKIQLSVKQLKNSKGCAIRLYDFDFKELEVALVRQIQGDEISMILIHETISLKLSEYEKTWIAYGYGQTN